MSLNRIELGSIVAELNAVLPGSFLNKINAPASNQVQLIFRPHVLLVDLNRGQQRIHLIEKKRQAPPSPPAWIMKGRTELMGLRFARIEQLDQDRAVRIDLIGRQSRSLLIELFGAGKMLLLNERQKVILPFLGTADPQETYLQGQPPEISSRFCEPNPTRLSVNRACAQLYSEREESTDLNQRKTCLTKQLRKKTKRIQNLLQKLKTDFEKSLYAESLARQAEAIKYQLGSIQKGQRLIVLPDPYNTEDEIEVALEPALGPIENMKRMFRKSKRLLTTRQRIGKRRAEAEEELLTYQRLLHQVMTAEEPEALDDLTPKLESLGVKKSKPLKRTKPAHQTRLPYRQFRSETGKAILVGRSGRDNHELTFRVAKGHDLWLHTRDAAGAHVIIRLHRSEQADEQSLLDAASLAAYNSPLKNNEKIDVLYTRVKNVHPIKGASPGLVSITRSKNLLVRMQSERIARLKKQIKKH
jgi:predicted ribosome quality control (RQC) complex YloA/Tae2 family protein